MLVVGAGDLVVEIEGFARNGGEIRDYQNLNHEKGLQRAIWWLRLKVLLETVVRFEIIKISTMKRACRGRFGG